MFNSAYHFHLIDKKKFLEGQDFLGSWLYNFNSIRRRYIVAVELYRGQIYIVKYYADCHSHSSNKFNLLLNDEKPAPIVRTCVNIMLDFFSKDHFASFGFIGSHSVGKRHKGRVITEAKVNTQRFRIYQTIMFSFFGQETFEHAQNVNHSAYLLINRLNHPIGTFKAEAEKMFRASYVFIDLEG